MAKPLVGDREVDRILGMSKSSVNIREVGRILSHMLDTWWDRLSISLGVSFKMMNVFWEKPKKLRTRWFLKLWIEKAYFGMNGSIVYPSCFHHIFMYHVFWVETSSPLLNLFKVTHLYYQTNFRYWGLSWFLRNVDVGYLFCVENLLIYIF